MSSDSAFRGRISSLFATLDTDTVSRQQSANKNYPSKPPTRM
jgi:hypothetical protein